jgi:hypothetical protein
MDDEPPVLATVVPAANSVVADGERTSSQPDGNAAAGGSGPDVD